MVALFSVAGPAVLLLDRLVSGVPGLLGPGLLVLGAVLLTFALVDTVLERAAGCAWD